MRISLHQKALARLSAVEATRAEPSVKRGDALAWADLLCWSKRVVLAFAACDTNL